MQQDYERRHESTRDPNHVLVSRELVIAAIALAGHRAAPRAAVRLRDRGARCSGLRGRRFRFSWPWWLAAFPLVAGLVIRLVRFEFSSDLLAGISIVTSVVLGEYLAGTLVVLMLSGGQALEAYAVRRASSALPPSPDGCLRKRTASRMERSARFGWTRLQSATCSSSFRTRPVRSMPSWWKGIARWTNRTSPANRMFCPRSWGRR